MSEATGTERWFEGGAQDGRPEPEIIPPEPEEIGEAPGIGSVWGHVGLAVAAGVLFDRLLVGRPAGVSVPLVAIAFGGVILWSGWGRGRLPLAAKGLLAAAGLVALTFACFTNPVLAMINRFLLPGLLGMAALVAGRQASKPWHAPGALADLALLIGRSVRRATRPLARATERLPIDAAFQRTVGRAAVGFICALPVLVVVGILLTSADAVFAFQFERLGRWFGGLEFGSVVWHAIVMAAVAWVTLGLMWVVRMAAPREPVEGSPPARTIDPVSAISFLIALEALYAVFVLVQFRYLFAAGGGTLPPGYTYAEYARRGFFELCVVTAINIALGSVMAFFVRRESERVDRAVGLALAGLMLLGGAILASAWLRLSLYEESYGYTYLRVFARTMIVLMGGTLALLGWKAWHEEYKFERAVVVLALALYIGLNFFAPDRFIASANIDRYFASGRIDTEYLAGLAWEATPQLSRLAEAPDGTVKEWAAAELAARKAQLDQPMSWTGWNLARWNAHRTLRD